MGGVFLGREPVDIAYTLLPPPLSAVPAKYWTSISLLLHSYAVARTFQRLVGVYGGVMEVDVPGEAEAFVIGFLHDMGQKLRVRGRPSEEGLLQWIKGRLEALGFTRGEADELARYTFTNPAEGNRDPLYDDRVWALLWLADRLQGIENPLDIPALLASVRDRVGLDLNIALLSVMLPQPFLRTLISRVLREEISKLQSSGRLVLPFTTPYGLAVLTGEEDLVVDVDWDRIRGGFDGSGIIPEDVEEHLKWNMECCDDPECRRRCSPRSKPEDCKLHGFVKRDCDKGLHPEWRGNSYKIALLYYGFRHRVEGPVILPEPVRGMLQGVRLVGVEYRRGGVKCPICGVETPVGVTGDFLQYFARNITTEQWARALVPKSVNALMQNVKPYAVDPLCLGEAIIRGQVNMQYYVSLTLRAIMPLEVLEEVAKLQAVLLFHELGGGMPKASTVSELLYGGDGSGFQERLTRLAGILDAVEAPNYFYDAFSSTVIIPYRNAMRQHQDEWIRDIVTAGVLSAWGIYPLTISEAIPSAPSETLLSYYKGRRPLYDYQPRDKRLGELTPYVAVTMASLAELSLRSARENLPALLEVLDYPPQYSPLILQYSSPTSYSLLESLRARIGVGA